MHNGARDHHDHGHGWPRWPRVGAVPYQALPLLRFFTCNIRLRKNARKGEGEPGNEASREVHVMLAQFNKVTYGKYFNFTLSANIYLHTKRWVMSA